MLSTIFKPQHGGFTYKNKFRKGEEMSNQKTVKESIKKDTEKIKRYGKISKSVKHTAKNQSKSKKQTAFHYHKKQQKPAQENFESPVKIAFLGGLNEVGKNLTVIEYNNEIVIIDCGLAFPDASMPGIDLVIPDFTYLEKNAQKVKGIFITHGHEDHIGGLSYLLKVVNAPVYSTKLTLGLVEYKLREAKMLSNVKLNPIKPDDKIKVGGFEIEAIHVNHSIPDALAFAVRCKEGVILHTGDFKIDSTPIDGDMMNLARLGQLGNEGVLCLLSDSTNAERSGYTESEKKVGESFENLFRKAGSRRLIVATFASNIHRVQQIINVAASLGRKVALSGRSLENVVAISKELGYLNVPDGVIIGIEAIRQYTDEELVIITTGSQGEPMSALTRMSMSDHRKVSVGPNDYVIISATPIPGNEKTVGKVVNELMKLGANVVYERMYEVHVSGHACQEELKLVLGLVKPKFFIPAHGEQKHLRKHAMLGEAMGVNPDNIIIAANGIEISFHSEKRYTVSDVPAGNVFVDGYGVGDVGSLVLRERKLLSEDGVIVVSAVLDSATGYNLCAPEIHSRGFVFVKESSELFSEAEQIVVRILDKYADSRKRDINALKGKIKDEVLRFMYEKTKRSPVVIPVIQEI